MSKKIKEIVTEKDTSQFSKNTLNAILNGAPEGSHFNDFNTQPVPISTGSLKLDYFIKLKSSQIIRLGGPAEVGKSSSAILIANNYMKALPKSKTIYVNAEAKFGEEIQARMGMKFVRKPEDWEYGTVFILDSNCFDTICNTIHGLYKTMNDNGEHLCVIIDSVDMLMLNSDLKKDIGDSRKPAGINYLTKELFRRVAHYVQHFNGLMIMITQYAATFKLDTYAKDAPQLMEGNQTNALNHQVSYGLYYRPRLNYHYIKEDEKEKPDPIKNKILGVNAMVDIRKSATDETNITVEVPIKRGRIGNAIWTEKEIFDTLVLFDMITKSGSWLEISEYIVNSAKEDGIDLKPKHQGIEQFSQYFEENPSILEWMVKKIKSVHE
jgi:RecA/RadA recombinase